jgi:hypothetical protein
MTKLEQLCRDHYGGKVLVMAGDFRMNQSHLRRLMLAPGEKDRVAPSEATVLLLYLRSGGRIRPDDIFALPESIHHDDIASRLRPAPPARPRARLSPRDKARNASAAATAKPRPARRAI